MNTDLLFGGPINESSSPSHSSSFPSLGRSGEADGADYMSPTKTRSQEDASSYTTPLGFNLGRSQSAAPETWEYGNSLSSNAKLERVKMREGDRFFGRSGICYEEEGHREPSFNQSAMRRPASTGVIGRRNENNDDVNSILETLGLASLESSDDHQEISYIGKPMVGNSPVKTSIMEKIHEGGGSTNNHNNEPNKFFTGEEQSNNLFASRSHVGLQSNGLGSSSSLQNQGFQYNAATDVSIFLSCIILLFLSGCSILFLSFLHYSFLFLVTNNRTTSAAISMEARKNFLIK